jgi:serine/threonine protein kinase
MIRWSLAGRTALCEVQSRSRSRGQLVGWGTNGQVYKCVWMGQTVAQKIFSRQEVFLRERAVLERFKACPVFPQLVEPQPLRTIAMEFLEEVSEATLKCPGLFKCACKDLRLAVECLHRSGLVHNDIKPDNVMFNPRSRRFVLIDFSNTSSQGEAVEYADNEFVHPSFRGLVREAVALVDEYSVDSVIAMWERMYGPFQK